MENSIKSSPGPLGWVMGTLLSLFSASLLTIPLYVVIMALLWLVGYNFGSANHNTVSTVVALVSLAILVVGLGGYQSMVMMRKGYWILSDKALIQGHLAPVEVPLADIKEIGAGVPCRVNFAPKSEKLALMLKRKKKRVDRYEFAAKTTLILRLTNNRLLLFRINEMPHGLELMRKLLEVKADTVNTEIDYSEAELALMKVSNLNRIIDMDRLK